MAWMAERPFVWEKSAIGTALEEKKNNFNEFLIYMKFAYCSSSFLLLLFLRVFVLPKGSKMSVPIQHWRFVIRMPWYFISSPLHSTGIWVAPDSYANKKKCVDGWEWRVAGGWAVSSSLVHSPVVYIHEIVKMRIFRDEFRMNSNEMTMGALECRNWRIFVLYLTIKLAMCAIYICIYIFMYVLCLWVKHMDDTDSID